MKIQEIYLDEMQKKPHLYKFTSPQTPQTRARPNCPESYIPDWALGDLFKNEE